LFTPKKLNGPVFRPGDGVIDDTDLYAFIARFGTSLPPP